MGNIFFTFIALVSTIVFTGESKKDSQKNLDYAVKNVEVVRSIKQHISVAPTKSPIVEEKQAEQRKESSQDADNKSAVVVGSNPSLYISEELSSHSEQDIVKKENEQPVVVSTGIGKAMGGIVLPPGEELDSNPGQVGGIPPAGFGGSEGPHFTEPINFGDYKPLEIQGPGGQVTVSQPQQ